MSRVRIVLRFVAVGNTAARQIVRRHFDGDAIAFENTNAEATELSGDGREDLGAVVERDTEGGAREHFGDGAFELDQVFFCDNCLQRQR